MVAHRKNNEQSQLATPPTSRDTSPDGKQLFAAEEHTPPIEPGSDGAAGKGKKRKRTSDGSKTKKNKARKSKDTKEGMLHGRRRKGESSRISVMHSVPSLKKLEDYKSFPSFRAEMDDKRLIEFRKQQAVFVLADPSSMADPDKLPEQEDYWLALITDIRAKSKVQKNGDVEEWVADPSDVFVVVKWFYKPSDVIETPGLISAKTVDTVFDSYDFMGLKEVIFSKQESVISVFSCCDPVPIYYFDDSAPPETKTIRLIQEGKFETAGTEHQEPDDPEDFPNECHAAQENYFYRMTLPPYKPSKKPRKSKANSKKKTRDDSSDDEPEPEFGLRKHCICDGYYSPTDEIMRYCLDCHRWYHDSCLTESTATTIDVEMGSDDAPPLQLLDTARLPILRGMEWGIGGNINLVAAARKLLASGNFDDWEDGLLAGGLQEWEEWRVMMDKIQEREQREDYAMHIDKLYKCPTCDDKLI